MLREHSPWTTRPRVTESLASSVPGFVTGLVSGRDRPDHVFVFSPRTAESWTGRRVAVREGQHRATPNRGLPPATSARRRLGARKAPSLRPESASLVAMNSTRTRDQCMTIRPIAPPARGNAELGPPVRQRQSESCPTAIAPGPTRRRLRPQGRNESARHR